jgi:S-adenosyl methyltransferase
VTDATDEPAGTGIDSAVPHSARIWNYWLGGKDNYAVDREAGEAWLAVQPGVIDIARASRAFLGRTVRYLAGEVGIRQFLDVGTGLPTADNTHEVAQRVAPDARVVYVDNDPLVLAHARALLTSTPEGETRYLHADMHDPAVLIEGANEILDLTQPVAVQFIGVLGHVADIDVARRLVHGLMDGMPSGSHLTVCDGTEQDDATVKAQDDYADTGAVAYRNRPQEEIISVFDGLEWVEPGFVSVPLWRPDPADIGRPRPLDAYGGVGRKP